MSIINSHARRVGGYGFVTGWDMQVHNCTSGESEYDGFRVQHGSTILSSCKAFRAGVMAHNGLREGIAYPGKEAAGFHFSGAGHVIGTGLNSQNNTGAGIVLESVRGVALYGVLSDSNNMQAVTEWEGKWPWVSREYYSHKDQLATEKASGKDPSWRIAKPDSFDSIEFRGNTSHCIVEGISWASQIQGGYPIGYNHHAVSFQEGCHTNRVSIAHRSEDGANPRKAGGILNKKKTPEVARLKNRITDHLGNDYGMLPWTIENLDIPVVSKADRSKYQSANKKIIDKDKGILLWYKKETNQWIRTTDGKPD